MWLRALNRDSGSGLPLDYRCFLMQLGDGGAGPYYGLQTLEDSLYIDLDRKTAGDLLDPSTPFPHNAPWRMLYKGDVYDQAAYQAFEKDYFSPKWATGLLRVCNYGCGASMNLVVNGPGYGQIWMDSRGNDDGIYPVLHPESNRPMTFLEWYRVWLDESTAKLRVSGR